jgi:cell wall-associated NlpC family hydrolase
MTTPPITAYKITVPIADLTDKPARTTKISSHSSQLLLGETFLVQAEKDHFMFGMSRQDGYEGWIHKSQLALQTEDMSHFVDMPWAHIYPEPNFKTRPIMGIGFLSRISINAEIEKEGFVSVPGMGWIFKNHIKPLSALGNTDHVYTSMRFLGCPYLYGGRTALGVDCSGLTQLALNRTGIFCPRDSGPQSQELGVPLNRDQVQKGDLVFFPGHVGIMIDNDHVVNASARTMCVDVERLDDLDKIYAKDGKGGLTAIRRIQAI